MGVNEGRDNKTSTRFNKDKARLGCQSTLYSKFRSTHI